jgi:cell division protease FtsH
MNKINKKNIIIPLLIVLILSAVFIGYKTSFNKKKTLPYKSFITKVTEGNVSEVFISNSEMMKVVLKDNSVFYTENPRSLNLKENLLLKGIKVNEGEDVNPYEAVPLVIFFVGMISAAVYFATTANKRKGGAFKLSSMNVESQNNTGLCFENIAGNLEAKESTKELVDFIKNPDKYLKYDARMPRGVILYGPPGTGKTLMAKALASEAGVPFYAVNGSDFVQVYVGVGAGRIRDLFKKAREKGKAVIFIDEIDAIGKKRDSKADGGSDERDQTLNALLAEMSGFKESQGIIVMAATNRLDVLDEALLRPGRFDRHIEVGLPDVNARHEILKLHGREKPLSADADLYKIAQMTVYFSGAKLENLMNEAAILAARENTEYITMEQIDKAFGIVIAGFEKKDRSYIKENDKLITAYHEAGHAVIAKLVSPETQVRKVTIIPSTKGAGGYTLNIPPDRLYQTKAHLFNNIKIGLGGRAAEEIVFGKDHITTGASGDIENVTNTLLAMIKHYGMFENTGLLNYDVLNYQGVTHSEGIIKLCNETISELYNEVKELLLNNKEVLDRMTNILIEKETIYDEEIDKIVAA